MKAYRFLADAVGEQSGRYGVEGGTQHQHDQQEERELKERIEAAQASLGEDARRGRGRGAIRASRRDPYAWVGRGVRGVVIRQEIVHWLQADRTGDRFRARFYPSATRNRAGPCAGRTAISTPSSSAIR